MMARKSYKQKYQELKSNLEVDKKIHNHKVSYIHIPFSWPGIGRFFAFLGSAVLAVLNFMLIISMWKLLKLGDLSEAHITGFHQLIVIWPLVGEYILISLTVIYLAALIRGGFNKLNSYENGGMITGLIIGLICGLIIGLICGLIAGMITGLIAGLITGLIIGLICGLIAGLIGGLIGGLIAGLIGGLEEEFN